MGYHLVRKDADDVERLWARCVGAEGLFVDRAPLPREVLVLRGCRPVGRLLEAIIAPESAGRGLGSACVEVSDGDEPVQWWTLDDAVVIAGRADPGDPARYDIVLGAGVVPEGGRLPADPRFEFFIGLDSEGSRCETVDGLFRSRPEPVAVPMELIGCEFAEPLPPISDLDQVEVLVLDRHGTVMASHHVGNEVTVTRPSVLGDGLVDITVHHGGGDRPPVRARPIWDLWYQGPPAEVNGWAAYDTEGRKDWMELTTRAWRLPAEPDRTGGEHHVDGRFVTDKPGLHCAIAEALLGPGRYFGREWQAFRDCLNGGFGVVPPFTLIWHDAGVARHALADVVEDPEGLLPYFDEVVQLLERFGVTVVLRD
ncbi:barstar family protein [Actinoplanes subglobosus]|uniref:Barstar family protein n=1 Tax=Actinoplanes subglobosus TaxID=1547892 RepID=A0ABV8ITS9_9ACTN